MKEINIDSRNFAIVEMKDVPSKLQGGIYQAVINNLANRIGINQAAKISLPSLRDALSKPVLSENSATTGLSGAAVQLNKKIGRNFNIRINTRKESGNVVYFYITKLYKK